MMLSRMRRLNSSLKASTICGKRKLSENIKLLSFDSGHELSKDMMREASRWFDSWLKP